MADTQKDDAPQPETEQHPSPLEVVRESQNAQRETQEEASHNESIKDTAYEENKRGQSDNPALSNPRFQPSGRQG